ncbi:MAG: alpha/beta hydrolase [Clostridia bacterium]|nr:alpha/beta hydrolase [Clostridia bacterium]
MDKIFAAFWQNTKRMDDKRIATLTPPSGVTEINDIAYLDDGHVHHQLDVYYPEGTKETDRLPVLIDIHGGGWMYGDKELNKYYCLELATKGFVVFNMSYRLYPEVNARQQLWDISNCLKWINDNLSSFPCDTDNIYLTGDSAGGMLAAFTAMLSESEKMRDLYDTPDFSLKFNAVGLTSPVPRMNGDFPVNYYTRIMLGKDYEKEKWADYVNLEDILALGKMPPTFLLTSSGDFLARKETRIAAESLRKAGIDHQLMDFEKYNGVDLPHVFPVIYPFNEESQRAINEMLSFFKKYEKVKA